MLAAKMNTKRVWVIAGGGLLVAVIGMLYLFHPNDLGLTGFDLAMGGHPRMDALRTNTKAAADSFLAQRKTDLADSTGGDYELAVDYSKSLQDSITWLSVVVLLLLLGYLPPIFLGDTIGHDRHCSCSPFRWHSGIRA